MLRTPFKFHGSRLFLLCALVPALIGRGSTLAALEQSDLFVAGTAGYHTYRIPAIVVSTRGTLLAFCEGRKNSGSDAGKIDLLLKRSTDGGKTWTAQQVIWSDGSNTCGNPAPVVDRDTGVIWLLMTWNLGSDREREIERGASRDTRRVFVTHSDDDGLTWVKPLEITGSVKKPGWHWYATGPVNGIQLTRSPYHGRLIVPANHSEISTNGGPVSRSHIIYSDDHGKTWKIGGIEDEQTNESTVAELADGSLLQNMRSGRGKNRRAVATSHDAGLSWSSVRLDPELIEPVCQGSLLRYSWPEDGKSRILFANPASTKRERLTVRSSYDEGATWPVSRAIHAGPSAYSGLAVLPDKSIGCIFECGEKSPYERIAFARFPLDWLEQHMDWKQLPPLPDALGVAAPFAGVSGGALIVAGGANFPGAMPWDGGEKVWHDSLFVLPAPKAKWISGFKLPRAAAYGVSVTIPDGVLCAGGSYQHAHFRDVFLLQWADGKIETKPLPPLPKPMANGCGACVGSVVYLAGGTVSPDATNAMKNFWALDLAKSDPAWRELEPWPGPGRMLGVAGALGDRFFLFSGTELHPSDNGKPMRTYLKDAYRFTPNGGWKRIADLPRTAVAAPSPAIARENQLLIVSGDDGELVDFEPKEKHPGFPRGVLSYDPERDAWGRLGDSPLSRATAPIVQWQKRAVIVSGEVRPGVRTPEIWSLDEP